MNELCPMCTSPYGSMNSCRYDSCSWYDISSRQCAMLKIAKNLDFLKEKFENKILIKEEDS